MKAQWELRFECQPGCTKCCDQQGFVYLAPADVPAIAGFLGMAESDFESRYVYRTSNRIRLRTPRATQCHFLRNGGCSIHPVKPVQCRAFPFWPELLESRREWNKAAQWCPGMNQGPLVQIEAARAIAAGMRIAYPGSYEP